MMTTKKSLLAMLLLVMATSVQAQGLKDAYKNYFKIGVAVNQRNVVDPVQTDLIKREFNSVTAENDMKPEPTEPKEGVFDWEGADNIANFCRQNGLKMRGHCLHCQFLPPERSEDARPLSDVALADWQVDV